MGLSSRFPFISPGAAFTYKNGSTAETVRRHFVDGGYYENSGTETLLQVLNALPFKDKNIKPYTLQLNFGHKDSTFKSVTAFNEGTEILGGIYNTRSGRGAISHCFLEKFVKEKNGELVSMNLKLTTKQFPMNWILSQTAVKRLKSPQNSHFLPLDKCNN